MDRTTKVSTSVLIVGRSLNGLTMAMLLARRRVPGLVVERQPRTSIQYKFRGISPRSMEIYRSAGIEAEIRARRALQYGARELHGIQPAGDLADVPDRFSTAYAVRDDGAVLIRPDGFIAWRQVAAASGPHALDDALEQLRMRTAVNSGGPRR